MLNETVKKILKFNLTIRKIAILSLMTGILLLIFYFVLLMANGYIFFGGKFSLENTYKIVAFIGSCVGVFFALAGTLLVYQNLQITRIDNEKNQILTQKNQFESIYFNLLKQQRQMREGIRSVVQFSDKGDVKASGINFFDNLATRISMDFLKTGKTQEELINLYEYWFMVYNSDLGHLFNHIYHIINFVDKNPYFDTITNGDFFKREDYINILKAQLSNSEVVLIAVYGLTKRGGKFRIYIDNYKLLENINLELDMPEDHYSRVPGAEIIAESYPQLNDLYMKYFGSDRSDSTK